jgi:hypothetical protein
LRLRRDTIFTVTNDFSTDMDDREKQIQDAIDAVRARQLMHELALIEVLQAMPRHSAIEVANGLRARVSQWTMLSGAMSIPAVDEAVSEQLATFLGVLENPQLSLRL